MVSAIIGHARECAVKRPPLLDMHESVPQSDVRKHVTDMFGKLCVPAGNKFCVKSVNIVRNSGGASSPTFR
uniref:DNA-directed RNA polymerase n=1 Tax=Globodera pallida TaxID=36090 RepID=A0A183BY67_GLOPA